MTFSPGNAIFNGIPGNPAPVPTSIQLYSADSSSFNPSDGVNRGFDAAEQPHGRAVQHRGTYIDQVAREKHQVGPEGVHAVCETRQLPPGRDDRPQMDVRELHDAQPVERRGQRRGAHLRPADAQARTARRDPYHECGEHRGCGGEARAAQSEEVEGVEGQTRQHGRHPDPEKWLGKRI